MTDPSVSELLAGRRALGGTVGRRPAAGKAATAAAVFSALSLLVTVPHLAEDAAVAASPVLGSAPRGVALVAGAALTAQLLFAFRCLRQRRSGYVGVFLLAVMWLSVAATGHWRAFTTAPFRAGLSSRLLVWGMVITQGGAVLASLTAMRSRRRSSFLGTGNFGL